jgi:hypothetical protein
VFIESLTKNPLWIKQGNCDEKKRIGANEEPLFRLVSGEDADEE